MAPKKHSRDAPASSAPVSRQTLSTRSTAVSWHQVLQNICSHYVKETPQRTKLLDAFLLFLAAAGTLQFLYCVLAGNYVCPPIRRNRPAPAASLD